MMKFKITAVLFLFTILQMAAQIDNNFIKVGEVAPRIVGVDQDNQELDSKEILKKSEILLLFYRGNWCPYCKKHLMGLQENLEKFNKIGVKVIVVTPEKIEKIKETVKMINGSFSIVYDKNNKIMNDYLVAFDVNETNVPKYLEFTQNKIREYNEEKNEILPVPATYIIGKNGKVKYVHYDPNYSKRASFEELLKVVKR